MNAEQIAKLKELAQAATPGPWATDDPWIVYAEIGNELVYLANTSQLDTTRTQYPKDAAFIAAANPSAILELIALAEHPLSAQDEVLTDDDLTQEFSLDAIIKGIRYADHGRHEGWQAELKEYIRIECNRALLAATPSPAVAVEPVAQMICPSCGKNRFKETCPSTGHCPMIADAKAATPSPSLAVREKPNADCSGEPANCPDNEGYGCACDPMNKAAEEKP